MIVRFTWEPREWREVYLLSTTKPRRTGGSVPMSYLIVGLMALGGVGDLFRTLRENQRELVHGSLVPVLLGATLLLGALIGGASLLRRWRRLRLMPPQPIGEQELALQELGWRSSRATPAASVNGARGTAMQTWPELRGRRSGRYALALLTKDGNLAGAPLRAFSTDQWNWADRLLLRKMPREAFQADSEVR